VHAALKILNFGIRGLNPLREELSFLRGFLVSVFRRFRE